MQNLNLSRADGQALSKAAVQKRADADGSDSSLWRAFEFVIEADRLKRVDRRVSLTDRSRLENSAEHSWHAALAALVLKECASPATDVSRVLRMLLVHDLVEIDAGDTFLYDTAGRTTKKQREAQAAARIFGLLPHSTAEEMFGIWREYDRAESEEAVFAKAIDALLPIILNYFNDGGTWRTPGVTPGVVYAMKRHIAKASPKLWSVALGMIRDAIAKGYFSDDAERTGHLPLDGVCEPFGIATHEGYGVLASHGLDRVNYVRAVCLTDSELEALSSEIEFVLPQGSVIPSADPASTRLLLQGLDDGVLAARGREASDLLEGLYTLSPFDPLHLLDVKGTAALAADAAALSMLRLFNPAAAGRALVAPAVRFRTRKGEAALLSRELDQIVNADRCVIVLPWSISGMTAIALIDALRDRVPEFYVYSAFVSHEAARAVTRFAHGHRIAVHHFAATFGPAAALRRFDEAVDVRARA